MVNINLGKIKCIGTSKNRIDGLVLKRNVTIREAKYILVNILGIELLTKDDFEDLEEYQEQNKEYTRVVNDWLSGKTDDTAIMEFAYDCSDDAIGIFNLIAIIYYLKKILTFNITNMKINQISVSLIIPDEDIISIELEDDKIIFKDSSKATEMFKILNQLSFSIVRIDEITIDLSQIAFCHAAPAPNNNWELYLDKY